MDIEVTRFVRFENIGALKAFCDVAIDGTVLIKGIRIVEGRTGPFVTMPRQQNSAGKWYDNVVVLDKNTRDEMNRQVLEAYFADAQATETTQKRGSLMRHAMSLITAVLLYANTAYAQVPHLVRYQGFLKDSQGAPLDGPYTLTFRLYAAETGGTPVWTEPQSVSMSGGNFSVLLGSVISLDSMDWSQPRWLSIQVESSAELSPRQQIASVPLAIRAETAEIVKTSGLTDDAHNLVPSGSIILWGGAACPVGYTRNSAYDNRFLVGSPNPGVPGGSNTHAHGPGSYMAPVHTHTIPYNGWNSSGSSTDMSFLAMGKTGEAFARPTTNNVSGSGGGGAITGTSEAVDSRPAFRTILLCQKD